MSIILSLGPTSFNRIQFAKKLGRKIQMWPILLRKCSIFVFSSLKSRWLANSASISSSFIPSQYLFLSVKTCIKPSTNTIVYFFSIPFCISHCRLLSPRLSIHFVCRASSLYVPWQLLSVITQAILYLFFFWIFKLSYDSSLLDLLHKFFWGPVPFLALTILKVRPCTFLIQLCVFYFSSFACSSSVNLRYPHMKSDT